ncbi:hypothetical protein [Actinomycetospora aeridis]|uniref:Uncharacterized protein n=1 Tax=Actinomycetospora aeridis TaxID=3129231 RepID=A0ABU8NFA9_9PSEU
MTLASHVQDGALGAWFRSGLATPDGRAAVHDVLAEALRGRRPMRSPRHAGPGHAAQVQAAVRARLGFVVQHAPPYRALTGAHRLGLASPGRVHELAGRFPSHAALDPARRREALRWRPSAAGWIDAGPWPGSAGRALHPPRLRPPRPSGRDVVGDVVSRALALLDVCAPPGRLGGRAGEAELARACTVLVGWATGVPARAAVPEEVADLVAVASESGVLHRWRDRAGSPPCGEALGVTDAVFVPGWAEGGIVVAGAGDGASLLVDVLTLEDPLRRLDHLVGRCHHLLARAWLDRPARHGVGEVGLYLARHGVLVTWPVDELATVLGGGATSCRFGGLVARAAAADGVRLGAGLLNEAK